MSAGWVARAGPAGLELVEQSDAHASAQADLQIIFGGELTRRAAPRAAPVLHEARAAADLVLEGYRRAGESVLADLRGAFGFVLHESQEGVSLCVRDPLGVQPLFTSTVGDDVLVSTSIESLLAQPSVSRHVNLAMVADHLRHRWPDPGETYFTAVRRIPPGHALRVTRSGTQLFRYWQPLPVGEEIDWVAPDEIGDFDELFESAVLAALQQGPAAIFLSGGLDSVSVAAMAGALSRAERADVPRALSLVFPDPDVDESRVQSAVAASLGLSQTLLSWQDAIGEEGLVRQALELSSNSPAPPINLWAPAYDSLAREGVAHGSKVILTGAGGDEWLGVSPFYAADLLRRFEVRSLWELVSTQRRSYQLAGSRFIWNTLWRFGLRPLVLEAGGRRTQRLLSRRRLRRETSYLPPWLAPASELRAELIERAVAPQPELPLRRDRGHFYVDAVRRSLDHALVSVEMEESFLQGQRVGAPIVGPFWDADLLEFLCRVPPELLNRGGRAKGLVREAVARRFPELAFEQQRKMSSLRFGTALFAREVPPAWDSLGGPRALADAGVVAGSRREDFLTHDSEPRSMQTLWNILNLEVWLRSHL